MPTFKQMRGSNGVIRDGAFVPNDDSNPYWVEYQAFLAGGGIVDAAPELAIVAERATAQLKVDNEAAAERIKTLAGASNLVHFHMRTVEAEAAAVDGTPTAGEYPLLAAEVGVTGIDIAAVATAALADRDTVKTAWAAIEAVRVTTNNSIATHTTVAQIEATLDAVVWP